MLQARRFVGGFVPSGGVSTSPTINSGLCVGTGIKDAARNVGEIAVHRLGASQCTCSGTGSYMRSSSLAEIAGFYGHGATVAASAGQLRRVLSGGGASASGFGVRSFRSACARVNAQAPRPPVGPLLPHSAREALKPTRNVITAWGATGLPRNVRKNASRAAVVARSGAGLGGPHPASAALQVEAASTSSRAFVRRYGPVWGVVTAGAAAKLGLDHYREYAECHQLLQPWTGKMIKMDAGALATRQAETLLGRVADGMWCIVRGAQLLVLFLPLLVTAPLAFGWGSERWRDYWGDLLLQTLMLAGPAFMKWGQWAAARPDVCPQDLCRKLEQLHMDAPTHSPEFTQRAVTSSFGVPADVLFDEFERQPMASGTIGQVHRAVLSQEGVARLAAMGQLAPPAGTRVAVKVRHPGVQDAIRYDFTVLKAIVRVLNQIPSLSWMHLDEMTWQFESLLAAQVDFTVEGEQLEAFNHNFRKWDYVAFPKPILAHPAVLVETFEEGVPLTQYTRGQEEGSLMNRVLAKLGLSVVLKMMLVDNLVHADLHPGNILVRELPNHLKPVWESFWCDMWQRVAGEEARVSPQLVLVDAGMTAIMDRAESTHLVKFFQGVSSFDGNLMGKAMIDFSVNFPDHLHDPFCLNVSELMNNFKGQYAASNWASFSESLNAAMGCVRDYHLCMQGHICTVIVTSMMLSDLQQRLDPECSVMRVLDKILLGQKLSTYVPGLEDAVEWLYSKNSVRVPKELTSSETGSDDDDSMVHVL